MIFGQGIGGFPDLLAKEIIVFDHWGRIFRQLGYRLSQPTVDMWQCVCSNFNWSSSSVSQSKIQLCKKLTEGTLHAIKILRIFPLENEVKPF